MEEFLLFTSFVRRKGVGRINVMEDTFFLPTQQPETRNHSRIPIYEPSVPLGGVLVISYISPVKVS